MNAFNEWWQKEEDLMRKQGANDEVVLDAMRNIVEMAWSASRRELYPYEEAQCFCGDIYSPDMNLNACIVIQETGYCPNCIAMEMREYKK